MKKKPSLLVIGNSNVGKSSITKLLLPNPKEYKGKTGKKPGSTLLIRPITQDRLPYSIIDLPGFGYMKASSKRREEHIKQEIVKHIEKHHKNYFFALVVLNILRIEDELSKYFIEDKTTIPLSFELITFLKEFEIPLIVIINKIDKVSKYDEERIINLLVNSARNYNLNLVKYSNFIYNMEIELPYLKFSALKKTNLGKLKQIIQQYLQKYR